MPFLTAISFTKTHLKATGETAFEMGVWLWSRFWWCLVFKKVLHDLNETGFKCEPTVMINFELIVSKLGGIGPAQIIASVLLGLTQLLFGTTGLATVFIAYPATFRWVQVEWSNVKLERPWEPFPIYSSWSCNIWNAFGRLVLHDSNPGTPIWERKYVQIYRYLYHNKF